MLIEGCKRLKAQNPELYQRMKMTAAFNELITEFPSPQVTKDTGEGVQMVGREGNLKSFFVLATARVDMGGRCTLPPNI